MQGRRTGPDVEEVLQRARADEAVERERDRAAHDPPRTKRVSELESPVLRMNRRPGPRKVSTFSVILTLFGVALLSVLYIGHIITMNHMAVEADTLQTELTDLNEMRDRLLAEIDRKSARERIVGVATSELGLSLPKGQANWITVGLERNDPGDE